MVVIENVSRRLLTLVLTGKHLESHPTHPHRPKNVRLVTVHHAKNGALAMRSKTRPMADALRLAVGEQRELPDDAVLHCPEVKKAIARGDVRRLEGAALARFETQKAEAAAAAADETSSDDGDAAASA